MTVCSDSTDDTARPNTTCILDSAASIQMRLQVDVDAAQEPWPNGGMSRNATVNATALASLGSPLEAMDSSNCPSSSIGAELQVWRLRNRLLQLR